MKTAIVLTACAATLALAACSKAPETAPATTATMATPGGDAAADTTAAAAPTALVALAPTKDSKVSGTLTLSQEPGGVGITGTVGNLEPGSKHGFHVHEKGDCSAPDAASAGGHFNPSMGEHGNPGAAGGHHLGDIPNLEADSAGTAQVKMTVAGATLRDGGPNDLIGKGVIVHAMPDDYMTQPSGNSGGRVACGGIS